MNTQRKMLLGGFTAALMIGAALVAFAVPVSAQTADAAVDADSTYVDGGVTYSRITSGSITYGDTKTIQVYDLAGACSAYACSTYTLWAPGASSANATAQAYPLNATAYAVTFSNVNFSSVGNWSVYKGTSKTVTPEVSIQVNATINYIVSAQKEFTYKNAGAPQSVEISVADLAGNAASNAVVTVKTNATDGTQNGTALTVTNGGNGKYYVQLTPSQGAGRYWITATRDVDGIGLPEYRADEAISYFDVLPGALTVTKVSGDAIGGFTRTLVFNVSYPDGSHALATQAGFAKTASIAIQDTNGTWHPVNFTVAHSAGQAQINVTAKPLTGHSYTLFVNLTQAGHADKEFQGTLTFTGAEPKALNLAVTPETVDVSPLGTPTANAVGARTVTLNITGSLEDMQPDWNATQIAANITVSGNTLFPALVSDTADAGNYTITFWPSEGDADLAIKVTYNGATETIKVPVKKGASVVADKTEFLVDDKGTIVVTVEDANGNRRADAEVAIYELQDNKVVRSVTPLNSTLGDGSAGKGLNGQYTLTFTPANVGNLTVYAVIGSGSAQTYGYAVLRAVPSHDLTVNMNATEAPYLAGKAYTWKFNVTNSSGFYTAGTDLAIFDAAGYAKFLADPSTATPVATLQTGSGSANITDTRALSAGTYYLYAYQTGNKKHDNLVNGALPSFSVGTAEVTFSHSAVVKTLDIGQNVSVSVKFNGEPVNGTLRIKSGYANITAENATSQSSSGEFPVGGQGHGLGAGLANFTIAGTSKPAAEDGVVMFQFKPDTAGSSWVDIAATMKVVAPTINVDPAQIYIGESNRVQVTVTHTVKGTPIANARVELYDTYNANKASLGTPLANKTTGADGKFVHQFFVASSGNHSVWVNDDFAGNVTPVQGLAPAFDLTQYAPGETVTVTVLQRGTTNAFVSGAQIMVGDEVVDGVTDENGQITFAAPETVGTHKVTATADGFASGFANLKVFEEIVEAPEISLKNLKVTDATGTPRTTFKVGEVAVVSVTLENTGNGAGSETLSLMVNGLSFSSADVTVQPGKSVTRAFTTPAFAAAGDYTLTINDLTAVTVKVEPLAGQTPGGQTPGGQTPGGQTPGGQTPGNNQTPGGEDDKVEPGIPGFELVAALAAVGLAVLVIRRRN